MNSRTLRSVFAIRHGFLSLLLAPCSLLHAAPPPELTVLRQQYDKVVAERVTAPFEASLGELNTKFSAALDRLAGEAKKEGKLDEVLAIQDDQKRLAGKLPIPEDTDTTPASLKPLRAIYREQLAKLEALRTTTHQAILPAYTAKLQTLETTLTKADRIDEAKEVKDHRESLTAGLAAPAQAVAAKPDAGAAPGAQIKASSGKGDDRAAAELILSLGGKVSLVGPGDEITEADMLPKGRFSLARINFSKTDRMKRQLEEGDADKLAGLEGLSAVAFNNSVKSDEVLRFLATCPNLIAVHVENCGWLSGAWLQYVAPLKKIASITAVEAAKTDVSALGGFQSMDLGSMHFRNSAVDDDALAAISRFKKLRGLRLRKTRITDAGMVHLKGLKELVALDVSETAVTAAGLKEVASSPLWEIGFGSSPDAMLAALPEAALMFPKIIDFQYPPGGVSSAAHLAALGKAWPKLKRLEFPSGAKFEPDAFLSAGALFPSVEYLYLWRCPVTDEHLRGIAQMKKLSGAEFSGAEITDASVPELEKMKALKKLYIAGAKMTDDGVAALKKRRPELQITR